MATRHHRPGHRGRDSSRQVRAMMRVVLDTNVFLSAALGGTLKAVIERWRAGYFTLVVTEEIAGEYLAVLRRPKFGLPNDVIDDIIYLPYVPGTLRREMVRQAASLIFED
jgi:hypothetical protein